MRLINAAIFATISLCWSGQAAARPALSSCPPPQFPAGNEMTGIERQLIIDPALSDIAATDSTNIGVLSENGATICQPADWFFEVHDAGFLESERFFGAEWVGYEAFGYLLFDRAENGAVIDTGAKPRFSPQMSRIASIQLSDAAYGGLESFVIWDVSSPGLTKIYRHGHDGGSPWPWNDYADFRIDNWTGQHCIALSAVASLDVQSADNRLSYARRTQFHAREDGGWVIVKGPARDCEDRD